MPNIEYHELADELRDMGVDDFTLSCCDPTTTSFSFLQVQIQGDIYFSTDGVILNDPKHDVKCRLLLNEAIDRNIDLVLFPEYCISYKVLDEIVKRKKMWPRAMKLWCLPCQGISVSKFEAALEKMRNNPSVLLVDTAWNEHVNKKQFVNAFFYCFSIGSRNNRRLCLVPQIKTQHMSDPFGNCEMSGLTLGNVIFTINHRLITLLCADAINNEISWYDIQNRHLNSGLLLLHPQLNASPKYPLFCRLRKEIQTHNHSAICISCNWAADTKLFHAETGRFDSKIKLSWSCIYQKRQDFSKERWRNRRSLLADNSGWGLFGAYMERPRMEVWYSDSSEHALMLTMPNTASTQYAVTQLHGVKAEKNFCWVNSTAGGKKGCWEIQQFAYSLAKLIEQPQNKKRLGQVSQYAEIINEQYQDPFLGSNKYAVDCFFALTLPSLPDTAMTIDELENLADWTLLLNDEEYSNAISSLQDLYTLVESLNTKECIPPRLKALEGDHRFCLPEQFDDHAYYNVKAADQKMIIAFAKSDVDAHKISKRYLAQKCGNDSYFAEKCLGVIYIDIISRKPRFLPEYSSDVDQGDHSITEGDITNGG